MMVLLVMLMMVLLLLLLEEGLEPVIITRLILGHCCLSIIGQMDKGVLVYAPPLVVELAVDIIVCGVGRKTNWQRFERARLLVLLLGQLNTSSVILGCQ